MNELHRGVRDKLTANELRILGGDISYLQRLYEDPTTYDAINYNRIMQPDPIVDGNPTDRSTLYRKLMSEAKEVMKGVNYFKRSAAKHKKMANYLIGDTQQQRVVNDLVGQINQLPAPDIGQYQNVEAVVEQNVMQVDEQQQQQ